VSVHVSLVSVKSVEAAEPILEAAVAGADAVLLAIGSLASQSIVRRVTAARISTVQGLVEIDSPADYEAARRATRAQAVLAEQLINIRVNGMSIGGVIAADVYDVVARGYAIGEALRALAEDAEHITVIYNGNPAAVLAAAWTLRAEGVIAQVEHRCITEDEVQIEAAFLPADLIEASAPWAAAVVETDELRIATNRAIEHSDWKYTAVPNGNNQRPVLF